jgi:hypothetical protein
MTLQQRLNAAESLIKALQSGVRIVDQTFYQDPQPPGMSKERAESVVHTMLISIDLYYGAVAA